MLLSELFDEICTRRTFTEEDVKDVVLKVPLLSYSVFFGISSCSCVVFVVLRVVVVADAVKILDAVGYLHSMNVAHRDLKPENIMFVVSEDGTKNLKIIDFGFASKMDQPNLLDTPAGTTLFIWPLLHF